jgi:solute carrier family 32 (vesicular inhibitory amino acid transporter)
LSLPLGIKYAGWIIGMIFLFLAAVVTQYTAKLLAYVLDVDGSFVNYSDVAFISFGNGTRKVVQALFSLELTAANVALVVLFADSLNALIPGLQIWEWKVICGIILIPLNFVPLRLLAVTSVLGILCCTGLVLIVFIDGFIKPHSPGSLREPAKTYAFPESWSTLPLSFGLLMSPWGGHSVFPNVYRDMRHPMKYGKALNYTYISVYSLLAAMCVGGYLMFGEQVRDEITSNILLTEGYPRSLSILIVIFIAIIPLTKVPLR